MMNMEIFAFGNGEALFGLFNAIAAMMGGNVFQSSMAAAVVIGFFAASFAYVFAPHLMIGWKWLASTVLVFGLLITPRATVIINDELSAQPPRVVANVPLGLAALGSLTSSIAGKLTEVAETAFQTIPEGSGVQLPPELGYTRNGMLFANRVLRSSMNASFKDPEFRTDVTNYVRNCTFPDLVNGYIKSEVWLNSRDLWPLMADSNPARFSMVRTEAGQVDVLSCPKVYQLLNARMPTMVGDTKAALSYALNVAIDPQSAVTQIDTQIERAYATLRLGTAAQGAADLVRQNAMINAVANAMQAEAGRTGDTAKMMLALSRAQGVASANLGYINAGAIHSQMMPVLRSGIEFALYALFPFMVLMLLMSYGSVMLTIIKSYVMTAIWIQLWPPMFAIVNYLVTLHTAKQVAAAGYMGATAGTGVSLYTVDTIFSTTLSATAVMSYMVVAVPLMAAAVVWGAERLVSFAAAAGANAQRPLDNASSSAATGNVSLGNLTSDQLKMAPQVSSPYFNDSSDVFGRRLSGFGAGQEGYDRFFANLSQLPTSIKSSQAQAEKLSESARESETLASRQSEQAASSSAAALSQALGIQQSFNQSQSRSGGSNLAETGSSSQGLKSLLQVSADVNRKLGLDESSQVGRDITARATAGLKFAGNGAELEVAGKAVSSQKLQEAYEYAQKASSQAGVKTGQEAAESFSQSNAYQWAKQSGNAGVSSFDSSLRQSQEYRRASELSLAQAEEKSRDAQIMAEWSTRVDVDRNNWVNQQLVNRALTQQYERAEPEQQSEMILGLLREYYRPGGGFINGKWHPMSGPDPQPSGGSFTERYQSATSGLGGAATVQAAGAGFTNEVAGRQAQAGVTPGAALRDDVGGRAGAGIGGIRGAVGAATEGVAAQHEKQVDNYNQGTAQSRINDGHWIKLSRDSRTASDAFTSTQDAVNRPQKLSGPAVPDKPAPTPDLRGKVDQIPR
ncbi:MAG: conjugal transfer protein TraG N-terminal domain-containing protein [Betaproteobacteria bacterium]|nr:conjugal transfer protein TraG N-terminal domain-containing protein [Betaproteobacteria bacterium]